MKALSDVEVVATRRISRKRLNQSRGPEHEPDRSASPRFALASGPGLCHGGLACTLFGNPSISRKSGKISSVLNSFGQLEAPRPAGAVILGDLTRCGWQYVCQDTPTLRGATLGILSEERSRSH
jgi:hypothetical protein